MTEEDLQKIKAEIAFHALCRPCQNCGECERVLQIAIQEWRESHPPGVEMLRLRPEQEKAPCQSCRL